MKMLPIHCKVNFVGNFEEDPKGKDGYAIIPSSTKLRDLIKVALLKLEVQESLSVNAEGESTVPKSTICVWSDGQVIVCYLYDMFCCNIRNRSQGKFFFFFLEGIFPVVNRTTRS